MTGKERAYLRGLASLEDAIVYIGKGGITDNVIIQTIDALRARELIKGSVQESAPLTAREAADELARKCAVSGTGYRTEVRAVQTQRERPENQDRNRG